MKGAGLTVALLWYAHSILAARILGVFPAASISHQVPFRNVLLAMAARGHHVTVLTTDPVKDPPNNYSQVDLSYSYEYWKGNLDFASYTEIDAFDLWTHFMTFTVDYCDLQIKHDTMKQFIRSVNSSSFDLMLIEVLNVDVYSALWHQIGSPPVVGVLTLTLPDNLLRSLGSPKNPAFLPDPYFAFTDHMTLTERVRNTISMLRMRHFLMTRHKPLHQGLIKRHFGLDSPHLYDIVKDTSLVFVNSHWKVYYPQPLQSKVLELADLTIQTNPEPLSKELKEFLDGAIDGAIYFSLGTNVNASSMSAEKRQSFIDAFSELPQRVLWKWETEDMPGKPPNVMISKWLPQQSVLGHRNIKVFIMQGGLQSLQEAVYHGIPIVGVPFCCDQLQNVKKIVTEGLGVKLDILTATNESVLKAVNAVLHNPAFRERMANHSKVFRDELQPSLERAVWWLEYVLRHRGAPHLRPSTQDLHWAQYLLLDVGCVLLLASVLLCCVFWKIINTLVFAAKRIKYHT